MRFRKKAHVFRKENYVHKELFYTDRLSICLKSKVKLFLSIGVKEHFVQLPFEKKRTLYKRTDCIFYPTFRNLQQKFAFAKRKATFSLHSSLFTFN